MMSVLTAFQRWFSRTGLVRARCRALKAPESTHLIPVSYFGDLLPVALWRVKQGILVLDGKGEPLGILQTDRDFSEIANRIGVPVTINPSALESFTLWDGDATFVQYLERLALLTAMTIKYLANSTTISSFTKCTALAKLTHR